jgi:REP element-mobilizing transposase RayT
MDRVWLLTWTTYGGWLPGDDRGFVSNVRDGDGPEVKHNAPKTLYDAKQRGLALAARAQMKGPAVYLTAALAEPLADQIRETARFRRWSLLALAVMANHVHVVVGVPGDPDPAVLLRDFKSYGSRRLNSLAGKPSSETWWTTSGSRRKLRDDRAVRDAIRYVRNQHRPLLVWTAEPDAGEPGASAPGFSSEPHSLEPPPDTQNPGADALVVPHKSGSADFCFGAETVPGPG